LRTIALGYKDISAEEFNRIVNEKEAEEEAKGDDERQALGQALDQGLNLIAILGIKDPLRKEIVSAVQKCQQAYVTVRMVTGDNLETATAIAKDAGII
jgi:P-type E1-E2 ATPase